MNKEELLDKAYSQIENMDEKSLKNCLRHFLENASEDKIIDFINVNTRDLDLEKVKVRHIKMIPEKYVKEKNGEINEWVELIEEGKLTLEAEGYEDYSNGYWGSQTVWDYTDSHGIGKKIEEYLVFAEQCINDFRYEDALSIMELIMDLQVEVTNDWDDEFSLNLEELVHEKIINIQLEHLALKVLYCNYQIQEKEKRAESLYLYFEYSYFKAVHIEDMFKLGSEKLLDTDYFWNQWIEFLMTKTGDLAARLLREAILYHIGEEGLLTKARIGYETHPSLYLSVLEVCEKKHEYEKMKDIGEEALDKIDSSMIIRSEIALKTSLAAYFLGNEILMEKCWYEAYDSNTTVVNYLRLFTSQTSINKYKEKAEEKVSSKLILNRNNYNQNKELLKNYIDDYNYKCLCFFAGKFEKVKNFCVNPVGSLGWSGNFIGAGINLFLLYLYDDNKLGKAMTDIVKEVSNNLGFKKDSDFLFVNKNTYSKDSIIIKKDCIILWDIIEQWKMEYPMSNEEKNKCIKWIEDIIDKRTEAIVGGQRRNKYGSVALLIAALGEVKETLGVKLAKELLINKYQNKFPRHSAFRGELNNYK